MAKAFAVLASLALLAGGAAAAAEERGATCSADTDNKFVFSVNYYEGAWGQYAVEGCDGVSPTLNVERGVEYTLVQKDESNWMHPLGLAYYPDGAHGFGDHTEVPELEHPTPDDCGEADFACDPGTGVNQAPLYGIAGVYETYDDWNNGETSGLDVYEPTFFRPQDQWLDEGGDDGYGVKITIPTESKTGEFFYFCHIHHGMSGRIVVTDAAADANTLVVSGSEELGDEYYGTAADDFDSTCGTHDVTAYHSDQDGYCSGQEFLCLRSDSDFSDCMQAIDCKMNYEMRVAETADSPLTVFMHQMIPHHENAVQMARIAMKLATESEGYDDEDTDVPGLLRDIIATQNHQIQRMQAWLDTYADEAAICDPPDIGGVAGLAVGLAAACGAAATAA